DLSLLEFEVPGGLTVARVSGPEVRAWSQTGNRVQAWLERTTAAARLELLGWQSINWPAPGVTGKANEGSLNVPWVRLPEPRSQQTTVRFLPVSSLTLETGTLNNLVAAAGPERVYTATQPVYSGVLKVRSAAGLKAKVATVVEHGRDGTGQLTLTATID